MMRRTPLLFAPLLLAACPQDPPPERNPARLWLALNGTETMVRLVPLEPDPY